MKQLEGIRNRVMSLKFLKDHPICYVEISLYGDKSRNWAIVSTYMYKGQNGSGGGEKWMD